MKIKAAIWEAASYAFAVLAGFSIGSLSAKKPCPDPVVVNPLPAGPTADDPVKFRRAGDGWYVLDVRDPRTGQFRSEAYHLGPPAYELAEPSTKR